MKNKWKTFFFALLVTTITVQGYSIYTYANTREANYGDFYYVVYPLDYEPQKYWNLTNPDPYILEAIEHPGVRTDSFNHKDSTFWFTAIWDDPDTPNELGRPIQPIPFKYNGTYYDYTVGYYGTRLTITARCEPPEDYWNLTNPDNNILNAIENLGKTTIVNDAVYAILSPYISPSSYKPFQYNGTYYDFLIVKVDHSIPLPIFKVNTVKPEYTAATLSGIWITTGLIYIMNNKKQKNRVN